MTLAIRPMRPDDFPAVSRLFTEGDELHRRGRPDIFRPADPPRPREWLQSFGENGRGDVLVAEVDGEVVGLAAFAIVETPERPFMFARRLVLIDSLLVLEARRRQGIGQALMERVHAWARERGVAELELMVHEFNREAIEFYERLGYETVLRRMRRKAS